MTRTLFRLVLALAVLAGGGSAAAMAAPAAQSSAAQSSAPAAASRPAYLPPAKHVFVVNIENKDYAKTWGPKSPAPYLAKTLRRKGVLINNYYGTAHNSLGNYLAQISGQAPDPEIQGDCQVFSDFQTTGGPDQDGQYAGQGCVFPKEVPTLVGQMDAAGLRWRGYMQDMGSPCRHPEVGSQDDTQQAEKGDQYATRHNPFMYFHSVIDRPTYCKRHVVDLKRLPRDLKHVRTTRNLSYITPDLCSDGHDEPCVDGKPGGLVSINRWMRHWVPKILQSRAFKRNGVLIITADESDGPQSDASACCNEQPGPNSPSPGIVGPGGGKVGALVISRWTQRNSWSTTPYNHYALLASLEDLFGLDHIGFAAQDGLDRFGLDVFNDYTP